jgi:hypothetical protein
MGFSRLFISMIYAGERVEIIIYSFWVVIVLEAVFLTAGLDKSGEF